MSTEKARQGPIRIDERALFVKETNNPSGLQGKGRLSLMAPLAFDKRLDDSDGAEIAREYAISTSAFDGNVRDFTARLEGTPYIELYTANKEGGAETDTILDAQTSVSSLLRLLSAKEKAVHTSMNYPAKNLEKDMLADRLIKPLGLKKRAVRYGAVTERALLNNALYSYADVGVKSQQAERPLSMAENKIMFSEHISRLRVGAEVIHRELSRLLAFRAISAALDFVESDNRIIAHYDKEWARATVQQLDPTQDMLTSDTKTIEEYIEISDRRLALEATLQRQLYTTGGIGLPDRITRPFDIAREYLSNDLGNRSIPRTMSTYDSRPIEVLPSNPEIVDEPFAGEPDPRERSVRPQAPIVTPEALEAFRLSQQEANEQRRNERLARRKALSEPGSDSDSLIGERAEYLREVILRQEAILSPYRAQSSKHLRARGLVGQDSLDYNLRQSKLRREEGFETVIKLYDGLHTLIEGSQAPEEVLRTALTDLAAVNDEYREVSRGNQAPGRPQTLQQGLMPDLEWLSDNWALFAQAAQASKSLEYITSADQSRVLSLLSSVLGNEQPETVETSVQPLSTGEVAAISRDERNALVMPTEAIARANELAEQLEWVILPNHELTPDDLVTIAHHSLGREGRTAPIIDRERMVRLLRFREEYGGTLYRSSERMLGDSNNLYFVLTFIHPGDDNTYAIAENVVHGNATYVLRQDTMPLNPGESVLTAVQLSRKDVRELGARRIIHTQNGRDHTDKLIDAINELSKLTAI